MKLSEEKSHLLIIFGAHDDGMTLNSGASQISESVSEKLLGLTIDSKLNVNVHVNQLCVKANQKLYALARVNEAFYYYPLIGMFHLRAKNNRLNKINERAFQSSFDEPLAKDNSVSVHPRNLQLLMIEIYNICLYQATNVSTRFVE